MPVTPPDFARTPRFDPVFVSEEDLDDLATFTGMTQEACLERLRNTSPVEGVAAWRRTGPKTPADILSFYRSTDLFIWSLMQWHASPARRPYWNALSYLIANHPPEAGWRRVYDFGAGVGTDGLYLASRGYEVTLVDVDGPALHFARHRFARRRLTATFDVSRSPLPEPGGTYDAVICFDVFEHLQDPLEAARRLVAALRPGGLMLQQGAFEDDGYSPEHLPSGIQRFGGLRWHIHLAGLGLRNVTNLVYKKCTGIAGLAQRARFDLWRATGFWLVSARG